MGKMILCVMLMPVMCYCEVARSSSVVVSSEAAVYEYVPKVVIEGKWGKGPGEFGVISDPMDAEYLDIAQYPHSLGVNSEGDIYVLDQVNNRIQKFDKEGKYVKSISVLGLVDNKNNPIVEVKRERVFEVKGYPFIEGINIVIDSKDRMYYYLKRSSYNAEGVKVSEAGEVWEIENDKVSKKMKQGEEKPDKGYKTFEVIRSSEDTEIIYVFDNGKTFKFNPSLVKKPNLIRNSGNKIQQPVLTRDLIIFFTYGGKERVSYVYDKQGNLKWFVKGIIPGMIDGEGNGYVMDIVDAGIKVTKYEKKRINE